jgi:hypothetical protein
MSGDSLVAVHVSTIQTEAGHKGRTALFPPPPIHIC